jgi:hypothetical protein
VHHFRGGGGLLFQLPKNWSGTSRTDGCLAPQNRSFKKAIPVLMHSSAYLMIAALFLIGLELAYAFYQLAIFIL